jgi:FkbM family methyltransferase
MTVLSQEDFLKNSTSYSKASLDLQLKAYLKTPNGFFIEAGANDGVDMSNTKIYEDLFGWKGILVEASPSAYMKCKDNRKSKVVNAALVSADYGSDVVEGDFDGHIQASIGGVYGNPKISSFDDLYRFIFSHLRRLKRRKRLIKVPARTLTSILEENNVEKVDFFSLDVEGYELEVLKGLDFERWSPHFILVEIRNWALHATKEFLASKGYRFICTMSDSFHKTSPIWGNPMWDDTVNDYFFEYSGGAS